MKKIISFLGLVVYINLFYVSQANERLLVNTTYGSLLGKLMKSRSGREFVAFLGVPFASPPIGSLRFMPPKPLENWSGKRNATEEGNPCVQRIIGGDEDCLYLNIFTHNISANNTNLSTVMVYIHGGGFYGGSASIDEYGPEFLMDKDVVLVIPQYRLGVFGFLSTEDSTVPGNMGLKDQVAALKWVQTNVKAFGGDASKVTIFGNSAGSASVHLHMLSPLSQDLFARAISQSGTSLSAFAMIGHGTSKNITLTLAQKLKCPLNSSEEVLKCLQMKKSTEIQHEYSNLQDENYKIKRVLFRPVVENDSENAFLTFSPLNTATYKPWLVGVNANEGLFKINLRDLNNTINLIKNKYDTFLPSVLFFDDTCSRPRETARLIYDFYFKNVTTRDEFITSLEQVISDSWFIWPTIQAIQKHYGNLYCYVFEHHGEHSFTEVRGGPQGFGVSHMDEIHYILPQKQYFPINMSKEDTMISKLMVNLWVQFAKDSNPSPNLISYNPQLETPINFTWEACTSVKLKFCHLKTNRLSMVDDIFKKRIEFWQTLPIRDKIKK